MLANDISYATTYLNFKTRLIHTMHYFYTIKGDALLTRCEGSKHWCGTYFHYSHFPVKPTQQLVITKSSHIRQALLVQRCGFKTSFALIKGLQAAFIFVSL